MIARYRRALLGVYFVAVFGITLAPIPHGDGAFSDLDKLVHAALFGGLSFLIYWNFTTRRGLGAAAAASVVVAALIELAQGRIPYRSADVGDFLAGGAGVVAGIIAALSLFGSPGPEDDGSDA